MVERRLRLTILGGYLASGKTTGLRHLLHMAARPPWVLVNEAAKVAVDDHLLGAAHGVTVLAGGCACCTGRGALVQALRGLCDMRSRGQGPDEAILETSGLADPAQIVAAIRDHPVLGRLLATLRAINPVTQIAAASHGVDCAMPDHPPAPPLQALAAGNVAMQAVTVQVPSSVDWAGLSLWLSALLQARGDQIIRVKGVVQIPAGRLLLQAVRRVVQSPEVLEEGDRAGDDRLVFIGAGIEAEALARSLARFGRDRDDARCN